MNKSICYKNINLRISHLLNKAKPLSPAFLKKILSIILLEMSYIMRQWSAKNRPHTQYILLSNPRCGSSLLQSYLASHANILDGDTIFHQRELSRFPSHYLYRMASCYYRAKLGGKQPDDVYAVGIKMLYINCDLDNYVWRFLSSLPNLKVIHLKRQNPLRLYVSWEIAQKTNIWNVTQEEYEQLSTRRCITYSREQMYAYLDDVENKTKCFDECWFAKHEKLEIFYEDLISNTDNVMARIQQFLHVPIYPVHADLVRMNSEPLAELIDNYDQFSADIQGTPWEEYLDDEICL